VRRGVQSVALFATLSLACKRSPAAGEGSDAGAATTAPVANVSDAGLAPARCKLEEGGSASLGDVGDRRALVVGEGVLTKDGFVVGLVHAPATGAEALVARVVGHQVAEEWVVAKRGELVADAPPPKPLVFGESLYAAFIARSAGDAGGASRRIVVKKAGTTAAVATYLERADESLAFDAALSADGGRVALVWDEDAVTGGGITLAAVPLDGGRAPAPRVVSADSADPDSPRVAPRAAGGWWVAWTAHRSEAATDAGAGAVPVLVEGPAEDRAYSWIEVAIVGDDGAPSGAPRRITPALGHVASFDLAPRSSGELDVMVRDETQTREGEGGRVVHVVVRPDSGIDEPAVLVPAGVGRGSVDLVTGEGNLSWLTFADAQDRILAVPLGPTRAPLGSPSIEDVLEGGRLLVLAGAGSPARFAAAFLGGDGALFREATCAR
jgi:hypothetical protein